MRVGGVSPISSRALSSRSGWRWPLGGTDGREPGSTRVRPDRRRVGLGFTDAGRVRVLDVVPPAGWGRRRAPAAGRSAATAGGWQQRGQGRQRWGRWLGGGYRDYGCRHDRTGWVLAPFDGRRGQTWARGWPGQAGTGFSSGGERSRGRGGRSRRHGGPTGHGTGAASAGAGRSKSRPPGCAGRRSQAGRASLTWRHPSAGAGGARHRPRRPGARPPAPAGADPPGRPCRGRRRDQARRFPPRRPGWVPRPPHSTPPPRTAGLRLPCRLPPPPRPREWRPPVHGRNQVDRRPDRSAGAAPGGGPRLAAWFVTSMSGASPRCR